jgi:hypothetical protein
VELGGPKDSENTAAFLMNGYIATPERFNPRRAALAGMVRPPMRTPPRCNDFLIGQSLYPGATSVALTPLPGKRRFD